MKEARLLERLQRLERQIRTFKDLHASELQIVLDELSDITSELASPAAPEAGVSAPTSDPAASPKRAKWLAEQERKQQPMSRREFLGGRGKEDPS